MKPTPFKFIKQNYPKIISITAFFVLLFAYARIFAIGSPYQPGVTLDPLCVPGEVNCFVETIPDQTGNSGKYLTTNGSVTSWASVVGGGGLLGSTSSSGTETFIGTSLAGLGTASTNGTVFIGIDAGKNATSAARSFFGGYHAGNAATGAVDSIFIGDTAGNGAISARQSVFIGSAAGDGAANARRAIFIGDQAGLSDTVNNNSGGSSILIGNDTSTAGFQNSIALGSSAISTKINQFLVAPTYTNWQIGGVDYVMPSSSGIAGSVLTDVAGNGTLSWVIAGGLLGSTSTISNESWFGTDTATMGSACDINSTFIGTNAGKNQAAGCGGTMVGLDAGSGGGGPNSSFFGREAGMNADDALNTVMIGYQAGKLSGGTAQSIFIGSQSGNNSISRYSIFIGSQAGSNTTSNTYNSIFIGRGAGSNDLANNSGDFNDFSILIGNNTSTGGFSNSIAIGAGATNSSPNEFMIGSTSRPIDTTIIKGSASTECTITTGTGMACTSDERLKTNIVDLTSDTLSKLNQVRTVTFNWAANPSGNQQVGFIAQNLETVFPQLVATDKNGYKSVYYSQMTPILVKAIQDMDIKINNISSFGTPDSNSVQDLLRRFIGDIANNISDLYATVIHSDKIVTKNLCVGNVCVTEQQFLDMVNNSTSTQSIPQPDPNVTQ